MITKKEIGLRLKRFRDLDERVKYINKLLGKSRLVSKETKESLYSELGDVYLKQFKKCPISKRVQESETLFSAAESYAKAGELRKSEKLLKKKFFYDYSLMDLESLYDVNCLEAEKIGRIIDNKREKFRKNISLEKKLVLIIVIASFLTGIFYLSPILTNNAIANLTTKTTSIIGSCLFILGIIGSYFYFRER